MYRRVLLPSYGVAIAYVLGDTYDKTIKAYMHQLSSNVNPNSGGGDKKQIVPVINYSSIAVESADSFIWQMLASVTIPGKQM